MLGAGTLPGFAAALAPGAASSATFPYTVKLTDPDPLVNTATVHANPQGLPNDITASASATVDLVHPFDQGDQDSGQHHHQVGDTVRFTVSVQNTGMCP